MSANESKFSSRKQEMNLHGASSAQSGQAYSSTKGQCAYKSPCGSRLRRIKMERLWILFVSAALLFCLFSNKANALPWDVDMYKQESLKANEVARSPVKGTVPRGFKPFNMTNEEAGEKLTNPREANQDSIWHGQRLYNANCWTCHGPAAAGKGPVGMEGSLGVPNLLLDVYKDSPDGKVFGVIYNGGSNMPRYGYKFSHTEIWDIVNYLRFLQDKQQADGVKKP